MSLSDRVAIRYLAKIAREFKSPEALKNYLRDHPKADPKRHTVKKPSGPKKPEKPSYGDEDGLEALKGLSKGERKRVLEQALEDETAESKGKKPKKFKDVSKEEGMDVLKDLSHSEQKKVLEKALKGL